jgi:hypothetical protein
VIGGGWAGIGVALALLPACSLRDLSYLERCDAGSCSDAGQPLLSYQAEVAADAPILYLRLGESQGPTAVDQTGHANGTYPSTGITYGAPGAVAGDADTAITMDGTTAISMPPGFDFAEFAPFTVELWANQTAQPGYGFTLDHASYDQGTRNGWSLLLAAEQVSFERFRDNMTNGAVANSVGPLSMGTYHHVVITFDGGQLTLYIDAVVASLNSVIVGLPTGSFRWSIGRMNCDCSGLGFVGSLDEVALYSSVLPASRVAAHFHAAGR